MDNPKLLSRDPMSMVDTVCSMFVTLLIGVTVVFQDRVPQWELTAFQLGASVVFFLIARRIIRSLPQGLFSAILHAATILGLFGFIFQKMAKLQLAVVPMWMDDVLIGWEKGITGVESSLFLQRFVNPVFTEWMMFAYVIYVPLLWLITVVCYLSAGEKAVHDYLVNFTFGNIVCCIGFMLFPVASPLYHIPELYTHPLTGGLFTWCGEWIRNNLHFAGGSLPSLHCANGTIMAAMLYRYNRKLFFLALPTFLSLYVATVYGRYHYAWDVIAGILTAITVLRMSPKISLATDALRMWINRFSEARSIPESASE